MRMFCRNLSQISCFACLLCPLWQLHFDRVCTAEREREKLKEIIIIFVCLPWCCCCWDFIYVLYVGDTCINACFLACRITNAKFCHADASPLPALLVRLSLSFPRLDSPLLFLLLLSRPCAFTIAYLSALGRPAAACSVSGHAPVLASAWYISHMGIICICYSKLLPHKLIAMNTCRLIATQHNLIEGYIEYYMYIDNI